MYCLPLWFSGSLVRDALYSLVFLYCRHTCSFICRFLITTDYQINPFLGRSRLSNKLQLWRLHHFPVMSFSHSFYKSSFFPNPITIVKYHYSSWNFSRIRRNEKKEGRGKGDKELWDAVQLHLKIKPFICLSDRERSIIWYQWESQPRHAEVDGDGNFPSISKGHMV